MTAMLVFLGFAAAALLVSEWHEGRARRDARQRNRQPHARRVR